MGAGRSGERDRFVRDFFKHHGISPEGGARGPFRLTLTPALKRRLRTQDFTCVFQAEDLDDYPDGELMVPGNAVFDRILALARGFGAVSRRYVRARRSLDAERVVQAAMREAGDRFGVAVEAPTYRSSFLFTFRASYRSIETFDDLHAIMYSGLTGRYTDGDSFFRGLNLGESPEDGIHDGDPIDASELLGGALAALEERIHDTVERFVSDSEAHLQRERSRLAGFYTALIEEEKARLAKRRRAESVGAAERKLEWVNRLEQENRVFAPRVTVELIGLQEIRVPIRPVHIGRRGSRFADADLDLGTGDLFGLCCGTCGSELGELRLCAGEHLTCAECMEECADCASR